MRKKICLLAILLFICIDCKAETFLRYQTNPDKSTILRKDLGFLVIGYQQYPAEKVADPPRSEVTIYKYNKHGDLDSSFGTYGRITPEKDVPGSQAATTCTIDEEGNIYITGKQYDKKDDKRECMILWKYTPFGMPDKTFGRKGYVTSAQPGASEGIDVTVDAEGHPLVTGWIKSDIIHKADYNKNVSYNNMAIWKFNPNGSPDISFAKTGFITYRHYYKNHHQGTAILVDHKNDIYVFGEGPQGNSIWKYSSAGELLVNPDEGTQSYHDTFARKILLDKKDRLMIVSSSDVRRYPADTPLNSYIRWDTTFGVDGVLNIPDITGIDTENRLYIRGVKYARYLESGLPDLTFEETGCCTDVKVLTYDKNFHPHNIYILNKNDLICEAYTKQRNSDAGDTLIFWKYDEKTSCLTESSIFGKDNAIIRKNFVGKDVAVTGDGCLLVAGMALVDVLTPPSWGRKTRRAVIFKYSGDNRLDMTFGYNGYVMNEKEYELEAITVDEKGAVYCAGTAGLYKYTVKGEPDTSFGSRGFIQHTRIPGYDTIQIKEIAGYDSRTITDMAIHDNKIVVAGYFNKSYHLFNMVLWRYNADGSPDSSFGTNGVVTFENPREVGMTSAASSTAFDDNGNILVAGQLALKPVVWRYKKNGTLDNRFGDNGYVTIKDRPIVWEQYRNNQDIAIDRQGRILMKCLFETPVDDMILVRTMICARYKRDGTLDETFGKNGYIYSGFSDGNMSGSGLTVTPAGMILMAFNGMGVYRYNQDNSLDTDAPDSGFVTFKPCDKDIWPESIVDMVTREDEIIVLGNANGRGHAQYMALWRISGKQE